MSELADIGSGLAEIPASIKPAELKQILRNAGIPLETWGTGEAKTFAKFLAEIKEGESKIFINEQGAVQRHVSVLWVDVFHCASNGITYQLREDRQEYSDGRIRRRNLGSSIGEKMKPGETPEQAAYRALSEELQIHDTDMLVSLERYRDTAVTTTFPGIFSSFLMFPYVAIVGTDSYKPDGYVEYQTDKTNYYMWEVL